MILRKKAYIFLNFKLTKLFFDLTILINTLFLALQGLISRRMIDQIEDMATVLLSMEIILKVFVYKASTTPIYFRKDCQKQKPHD